MGYGKSVQSDLKSMGTENKYFQITHEGRQISKGQEKSMRAGERHKSSKTSLGDIQWHYQGGGIGCSFPKLIGIGYCSGQSL